jgi:hypothetical protein
MSDTIDHEKEIFNRALEINSAEARDLFLRDACAKDPAVRKRIQL